jgi:hypothetical protein
MMMVCDQFLMKDELCMMYVCCLEGIVIDVGG